MTEIINKERFLRLADVMARTGLSRSSIYLAISEGKFPQNVNIGLRSVGWLESEIDIWMQDRINQRSIASYSKE
ncbi:MAG: AlpA family transcriptional regulator [Alphaproteobacteria bacterium]|nr:AlpA family transcriptional regulator [Alphaproteobacteria bacterium]